MKGELLIYNTLSRTKEVFKPLSTEHVGMYVCGPTVYGDAHLGHAKSYVSFDLVYRYLLYLGYKVRYVQNITDVGHLTDDADEGDDKIAKQSRLERIDPMEVVERYMANYYRDMDALNNLRPSIAPRPSGHIQEQIEAIEILIEKGFAYEANGSVYFDVLQYDKDHDYGKLSGRTLEEMKDGAANRELDKQSDKRNGFDFALWKKADDNHLMKWNSPWGYGYPGWHIECTVMSQKYLGENFDIHGGGLENAFPHHECEIAQAEAGSNVPFANYWMHNNMVTINGQKMGKSLGNGIFCHELFDGSNPQLDQAFSPMTIRFFILQSHYRSTLDFSNEALKAAEKGFQRLMKAVDQLDKIEASDSSSAAVQGIMDKGIAAMNDDFNSPILIAQLFDGVKLINQMAEGKSGLSAEDLERFRSFYGKMVFDVLGLKSEAMAAGGGDEKVEDLMGLILDLRKEIRAAKNWTMADQIRDTLAELNIEVKDGKDGATWNYKN